MCAFIAKHSGWLFLQCTCAHAVRTSLCMYLCVVFACAFIASQSGWLFLQYAYAYVCMSLCVVFVCALSHRTLAGPEVCVCVCVCIYARVCVCIYTSTLLHTPYTYKVHTCVHMNFENQTNSSVMIHLFYSCNHKRRNSHTCAWTYIYVT